MKNKLQEYALIAEIIGGIAIVASLLFVGLQINQNNKLIEAEALNAKNERADDNSKLAIELNIVSITTKFRSGEILTADERARITIFVETLLRHFETTYFQYTLGLVNEEIWQSNLKSLESFISSTAFQAVFPGWLDKERTFQFSDSFVELVDELITTNVEL